MIQAGLRIGNWDFNPHWNPSNLKFGAAKGNKLVNANKSGPKVGETNSKQTCKFQPFKLLAFQA